MSGQGVGGDPSPFSPKNSLKLQPSNLKIANSPLCDLYFDCFTDLDDSSLSDSEPKVSYSVIGICNVSIFRTSESVEPGLSDSKNWTSERGTQETILIVILNFSSIKLGLKNPFWSNNAWHLISCKRLTGFCLKKADFPWNIQ